MRKLFSFIFVLCFLSLISDVNEFCVEYNWQFKYFALDDGGHCSFALNRIQDTVENK